MLFQSLYKSCFSISWRRFCEVLVGTEFLKVQSFSFLEFGKHGFLEFEGIDFEETFELQNLAICAERVVLGCDIRCSRIKQSACHLRGKESLPNEFVEF